MDSITRLPFDADIHEFSTSSPTIPEPVGTGGRRRFRTIWISDVHLGTRGCAADLLIDFLDSTDSETMYLVGDIIDGWRLKKKFYWPDTHNDIVWRIMKRAKRGTRVVYVPGNHDEMFRQYAGLNFGGVEIKRQAIHETADGRKLLVAHGDEFDAILIGHRWIAFFGDQLYHLMMRINHGVNWVRARLGMPYWSFSKVAKQKVKNAVEVISQFEHTVAAEAARRGVDGVVCGHIHHAEFRALAGVEYYNDGDWVEGCTALVEHFDGRMEILHWVEEMAKREGARPVLKIAA